jgi:hypothetical protein
MSDRLRELIALAWEIWPDTFGLQFLFIKPGHRYIDPRDQDRHGDKAGKWTVDVDTSNGWSGTRSSFTADTPEAALEQAIRTHLDSRVADARKRATDASCVQTRAEELALRARQVLG